MRTLKYFLLLGVCLLFIVSVALPFLPFILIAFAKGAPTDELREKWDALKQTTWKIAG